MATVTSFTVSSPGDDVGYSISWNNFNCGGTTEIIFSLLDQNRNARIRNITFTSVGSSGTITQSFTGVYAGLFYVIAEFRCNGSRVTAARSGTIQHDSIIAPPTPVEEQPPVTSDPNSNPFICIPTTGAVSMGDLNVVFQRARDLANTSLSGTSNPSVAPSLFGVSFLPNNVVSPGKLTPNAISEFRGYCHVEPIVNPTLSYSIATNTSGTGTTNISYINTSGNRINLSISLNNSNSPENSSGEVTIRAGSSVIVDFLNPSTGAVTAIEVSNLTDPLFERTGNFTSEQFTFVPNTNDAYKEPYLTQ